MRSPWLGRVHCQHCRKRIVPITWEGGTQTWVHSITLDVLCARRPARASLTLIDLAEYTKTATPRES